MKRLFAAVAVFAACIDRSCAVRARGRGLDRRRQNQRLVNEVEDLVVITTTVKKGKGGKGSSDKDSDDVGEEDAINEDIVDLPSMTGPPAVPPTNAAATWTPTRQPIIIMTSEAPSTASPTQQPTNIPTTIPPTTIQPTTPFPTSEVKAACQAAANKDEYVTNLSVTVEYLYELVFPSDRSVTTVAAYVDGQVQDFLVQELIECDKTTEMITVAGVGSGENDVVVDTVCSTLATTDDTQICHLMGGSVILYFLTNGGTLSDQEGFDQVEEKLRAAYNGDARRHRSLQSNFVNETLGILGLHYVGGRVEQDTVANTGDQGTAANIVGGSTDTTSLPIIPATVVPGVLVACVASIAFAALVVVARRRKRSRAGSSFLLDDGDESTLGDDRWKEIEVSKDPLHFKVVETTDDSDESGSSGSAAVVVAHDVAMGDLSGMTISESLSESSKSKPVFLDPDAVTIYTTSHGTRFYYPRTYIVNDTVEI